MTAPALPAGARIVKRGSFRLDRERAQEKIARFQLEDPRAYVLELIAAGVCAGAGQIELRIGPRDLEIAWDGEAPRQHELTDLFDWVFTPVQSRRARMMQHLAQAIYGARGLQPAAIVLDTPGLWADLTDPLRPVFGEGDRQRGARLVVRERFELLRHSLDAVTWVFGQAQELRLLRQRAALCPTPVHLGGGHTIGVDRLALPTASKFHHVTSDAFLWIEVFDRDGSRLSDRYPALLGTRTTVAVVRDGITMADLEVRSGGAALCGWVHADELQLDVSQARVVQDERWQALVAQLAELRDALIARLERPLHALDLPSSGPLAASRRVAVADRPAAVPDEPEEPEAPAASVAPADAPAIATMFEDRVEVAVATDVPDSAPQPTSAEPAGDPAPVTDAGAHAPTAARTMHRDDASLAATPLEALRLAVESVLDVAVERRALERACEQALCDLSRLGVAFLRDPSGSARILLAWQIADRLQLASGRPSLAVEMAPRVARALAGLDARPELAPV